MMGDRQDPNVVAYQTKATDLTRMYSDYEYPAEDINDYIKKRNKAVDDYTKAVTDFNTKFVTYNKNM